MSKQPPTPGDLRMALLGVTVNVVIIAALWFGRAYWLHGIERVVSYFQGQAARRKKNLYLQGNFAPVTETEGTDLEVVGHLPKAIDGVYARNGPNPVLPITGDYHWCV